MHSGNRLYNRSGIQLHRMLPEHGRGYVGLTFLAINLRHSHRHGAVHHRIQSLTYILRHCPLFVLRGLAESRDGNVCRNAHLLLPPSGSQRSMGADGDSVPESQELIDHIHQQHGTFVGGTHCRKTPFRLFPSRRGAPGCHLRHEGRRHQHCQEHCRHQGQEIFTGLIHLRRRGDARLVHNGQTGVSEPQGNRQGIEEERRESIARFAAENREVPPEQRNGGRVHRRGHQDNDDDLRHRMERRRIFIVPQAVACGRHRGLAASRQD